MTIRDLLVDLAAIGAIMSFITALAIYASGL